MATVEEIWNTNLQSLTQRAANNDEGAITALYNHYEKPMIRYARNYVNNNEDAQDAVQNAFINAFRHISSLEDGSKFEAWLRRIVRNEATSLVRGKLQNSTTYFTDMEDEEGNLQYDPSDEKIENRPDLLMDQQTTKELIVKILDSLPEEQRLVTMMYYYEHLTMKDIAEELDIPQTTVVGRINTAKKNIKSSVQSLEKTDGIKLYSMAPFTYFLYLLGLLGQTDPASIPMHVPTSISGSTRPAGHGIKAVLEGIKQTPAAQPATPAVHTVTSSAKNGTEGVLSALRDNRTAVNAAETAAKAAAAKAVASTAVKGAGSVIAGKILPIIIGISLGIAAVFGGGYIYKAYTERLGITSGPSSEDAEPAGHNTADEISNDESGLSQDNTVETENSDDENNVVWHVEPFLQFKAVYPLMARDKTDKGFDNCVWGYPQEWGNSGYTNNAIQVSISNYVGKKPYPEVDNRVNVNHYIGIYSYEGTELFPATIEYSSDHPQFYSIKYGSLYVNDEPRFNYQTYEDNNMITNYFSNDFKTINHQDVFDLNGSCGDCGYYPSDITEYVVQNNVVGIAVYTNETFPSSPNPVYSFKPGAGDDLDDYNAVLTIDEAGKGNGYSIVDKTGKILYQSPNSVLSPLIINGYLIESSEQSDGLIENGSGLYAVVYAPEGKRITDYIYENVKYFEDGYCPVQKNGKWGFIDEQGNEVTDFIWDDVSPLYNGYAYVGINDMYGVIDLKETISRNVPVTEETCYQQFGGVPQPEEAAPSTVPMGTLRVKVTNLNSRSLPSTSGDKLEKVTDGTEYDVYEIAYGEGYTWYRISEDRWIADDRGEWVNYEPR